MNVYTLKELLVNGVQHGIYIPKAKFGSGYKVVKMGLQFGQDRIGAQEMERAPVTDEQLGRYSVYNGDLLFSRTSMIADGAGKCSIVHGAEEPLLVDSNIFFGRPNRTLVEPTYLYYLMNSPIGKSKVTELIGGTQSRSISGTTLAELRIELPPLEQQRATAAILGSLDDKIELNRRINETLEAMARAIFRSWFVDFDPVRIKARGGDPTAELGLSPEIAALFPDSFQDSELGKIPQGWKASTVGKEFRLTMGQSPPGESYNSSGEGIPFYQGKTDYGWRFPERRLSCTAPTRFAEEGDTLVSVRAPVGALNVANERCCIGRGLAAVRHLSGSMSLTYYAMGELSDQFKVFEETGTVFGSITKLGFVGLPFVAPSLKVALAFDHLVGAIDLQIAANERESNTLAETRDYLLPRLLSGSLCAGAENA